MKRIRRQTVLRYAKKTFNCDTIGAFTPENIYYLTGFWGEGAVVCNSDFETTLIVPKLEKERASSTTTDCDIISA